MEALAILLWLAVLAADIAFMANTLFPLDEKRPGRAGTRTRAVKR